jgi:hypothetical protein
MGFLPFGAAGFYVGDSRLAATGLLWSFSILWMPGKAYNKAVDANDRDFESRLMRALEGSNAPGDSLEPARVPSVQPLERRAV